MESKYSEFIRVLTESLNFEIVDSDDEFISLRHRTFPVGLALVFEDGCSLSDLRGNGCDLAGIYEMSEYPLVIEILKKCETSAQGDVNQYILTWAESVPRVTPESLKSTRKYLETIQKEEDEKRNENIKVKKEVKELIKLAEEGSEAAKYNLYVMYSTTDDIRKILTRKQVEIWLLDAAKASGNVGRVARMLVKKDRVEN